MYMRILWTFSSAHFMRKALHCDEGSGRGREERHIARQCEILDQQALLGGGAHRCMDSAIPHIQD